MKTIETIATVNPAHQITIDVPPDVEAGDYEITLVIKKAKPKEMPNQSLDFPVDDYGPWPANLSLRREDMYGDFGR
ncbi:hypothetical protein [Lyngbya confervoides]|uniref:Uncharacterized protein n=1 Tax=Lyngbya confervoides BDU141951 TaxID=1574623 RepID=A0ABD4T0N8_9CYAN|nr:hypothetical protein [Lyngbya confervoides]MCM1981990.1 hypothetical protein [Lyngbya confervoides BDU141951]